MTCTTCEDHGLLVANWADAPTGHVAVCLCAAGQAWRVAENRGKPCAPFWVLWASMHHVPLEQMWFIEDGYSADELVERGFGARSLDDAAAAREAALRAIGRHRGPA